MTNKHNTKYYHKSPSNIKKNEVNSLSPTIDVGIWTELNSTTQLQSRGCCKFISGYELLLITVTEKGRTAIKMSGV